MSLLSPEYIQTKNNFKVILKFTPEYRQRGALGRSLHLLSLQALLLAVCPPESDKSLLLTCFSTLYLKQMF